ncbi:MAG: cyclic nucleotide-binding domain-containing protein [Myxococcaceae bacterium]
MSAASLRELGLDLLEERQPERALAVFAESVRREPGDHQARMMAARCLALLGEKERAVTAYHACAEGLVRRDYLLSAMLVCKLALELSPTEKRILDTLARIHARAVRDAPGKAKVPPPLPPSQLFDGVAGEGELMALSGAALSDRAIAVLATPDLGTAADPNARPPLPLFADLELDAFLDLVNRMNYRRAKPGEAVCTQGQGGESMYVLIAGKAEVSRQFGEDRKMLGSLSGGSIFGELSLLTGAPPTATVTATAQVELFEIWREHLNQLAKTFPSVPSALAEFAQARMARNLTATSPLFHGLDDFNRSALLSRFRFRALAPGETVLVEGEHSPGLFLVLAGELVVQKEDPAGGQVSLGVLREGDVAGEISLLTGLRASATVVSTRKSATAFLDRAAFDALTKSFPHAREYLQKISEDRLKQIGEALRPAEIIDADELVVTQDA